jgi:hypothetical protein
MNVGIQDAANLAWKLAAVVRRGAPPALLASYEEERRPVALATISGTDSATKLVTLKGTIVVALRDRIVPFILGRLRSRRLLLGASQRTASVLAAAEGSHGFATRWILPADVEDTSALLSHLERTLGAPNRHASPPWRALAALETTEAA